MLRLNDVSPSGLHEGSPGRMIEINHVSISNPTIARHLDQIGPCPPA